MSTDELADFGNLRVDIDDPIEHPPVTEKSQSISASPDRTPSALSPKAGSSEHCNVFIAGLPSNWDSDKLTEEMTRFGEVFSVRVVPERHYGFVRFKRPESAAQAIQTLHQSKLTRGLSANLHVCYAVHDEATDEQPNVRIFVRGLPPFCTREQLLEAFTRFGTVVDHSVITTHDGRCKGTGFVTYTHVEMATKALQTVNGQEVAFTQPGMTISRPSKLEVRYCESNLSRQMRQQRKKTRAAAAAAAGPPGHPGTSPGAPMLVPNPMMAAGLAPLLPGGTPVSTPMGNLAHIMHGLPPIAPQFSGPPGGFPGPPPPGLLSPAAAAAQMPRALPMAAPPYPGSAAAYGSFHSMSTGTSTPVSTPKALPPGMLPPGLPPMLPQPPVLLPNAVPGTFPTAGDLYVSAPALTAPAVVELVSRIGPAELVAPVQGGFAVRMAVPGHAVMVAQTYNNVPMMSGQLLRCALFS